MGKKQMNPNRIVKSQKTCWKANELREEHRKKKARSTLHTKGTSRAPSSWLKRKHDRSKLKIGEIP